MAQERGSTSNRYTILGRLAVGGMAEIFLVLATTEAGVDRYLVLKRVLAERSKDPAFVTMFLDEARLAAQLQHPNIAQVYDVGTLGGTYFYTMEYVHGEDVRMLLHQLAKQRRPLPENLALYVAHGALSALHHAHERTAADGAALCVVHRDVTPSNVMVGYEGMVKLLDFGVAKASQRATESRSGTIKGKIAYLSPEQCRGAVVDRRSDIYSLGIVLYEMLTGRRLYKRDSDFNAMLAITTEQHPPPSRFRPGLSPDVDRVVMTALEKDRDKRYPTAAAMLEELEAVATAERHLLSGAAMGRFMREVFGTKPEPWVELQARDADEHPVTVTDESIGKLTLSGTIGHELHELHDELDHAPDLRSAIEPVTDDSLEPISTTPPVPLRAPRRTRAAFIVAAVLVAAGAGAYYYVVARDEAMTSAGSTASPAEVVTLAPSTPVDAASTDASAPAVADAPADAALAVIDDAVARHDWGSAWRLCAAADIESSSATDRRSCGLAACNVKQPAAALGYHRRVGRSEQIEIERECRSHGIALVSAPVKPPQPRVDPCRDPAFVAAHPMRCQ